MCPSPRLFAAYRGLPRLCVPRHPPHAFARLTTSSEDNHGKQSTRSELARVERLTSNRYAISRHRTSVDRPEDRSSQDSMRIDIPRSTSILRFSNSGREPTASRGQSLHFINPSASRQVVSLAAHRPTAFRGGGKDIAPRSRDQPLLAPFFSSCFARSRLQFHHRCPYVACDRNLKRGKALGCRSPVDLSQRRRRGRRAASWSGAHPR